MAGLRERCSVAQNEIGNRRSQIDGLSTQLSTLARHQGLLQAKNSDLSDKMTKLYRLLSELKPVAITTNA